jgi:hypothetical protein
MKSLQIFLLNNRKCWVYHEVLALKDYYLDFG